MARAPFEHALDVGARDLAPAMAHDAVGHLAADVAAGDAAYTVSISTPAIVCAASIASRIARTVQSMLRDDALAQAAARDVADAEDR